MCKQLDMPTPAPLAPGDGLIRTTGPEWKAYGPSRRWKNQQVDELFEIVREKHPRGPIDVSAATLAKLEAAKPPLDLTDVHVHPAVPMNELWWRKP